MSFSSLFGVAIFIFAFFAFTPVALAETTFMDRFISPVWMGQSEPLPLTIARFVVLLLTVTVLLYFFKFRKTK